MHILNIWFSVFKKHLQLKQNGCLGVVLFCLRVFRNIFYGSSYLVPYVPDVLILHSLQNIMISFSVFLFFLSCWRNYSFSLCDVNVDLSKLIKVTTKQIKAISMNVYQTPSYDHNKKYGLLKHGHMTQCQYYIDNND